MTDKPNLTRVWARTAPGGNVVDPDTVTAGKYTAGWQAEVPPFEYFNFIQKQITQGLAHINEQGIAVWDNITTYPVGGLVKGSDGNVYKSLVSQSGNDPVLDNGTNWVDWEVTNRVIRVTSVGEVKALPAVADYQVSLAGQKAGIFEFLNFDLSPEVTTDYNEDRFIAPDSDPSGASGAWVRQPEANTREVKDYVYPAVHGEFPLLDKGAIGAYNESYREIGNVLYEPSDLSAPYKFIYTAYAGDYTFNNVYIGRATSRDGINWTNLGLMNIPRSAEDPYLLKYNGTYYVYVEDKEIVPFKAIRLYTSTDFVNWTDNGDVLSPVAGTWEAQDVSSPVVWIEGNEFFLMYEGRANGQAGAVGLATSTDGITWTRDAANPVITGVNSTFGYPGDIKWGESCVPNDIRKVGTTYILTVHSGIKGRSGVTQFVGGIVVSDNLVDWEDTLGAPIVSSYVAAEIYLDLPSGVQIIQESPRGITRALPGSVKKINLLLTSMDVTQDLYTAATFIPINYKAVVSAEGWDEGTSTFTVPANGFYSVTMFQKFTPKGTADGNVVVQLYTNGSVQTNLFSANLTSGVSSASEAGTAIAYLFAGDTVQFRAYSQKGVINDVMDDGEASINLIS